MTTYNEKMFHDMKLEHFIGFIRYDGDINEMDEIDVGVANFVLNYPNHICRDFSVASKPPYDEYPCKCGNDESFYVFIYETMVEDEDIYLPEWIEATHNKPTLVEVELFVYLCPKCKKWWYDQDY